MAYQTRTTRSGMMVALGLVLGVAGVALIVGWLCRTDIRNRIDEAAEHGIRFATFNPYAPTIAEARKLLASGEFEAWTHCPNCGRYAVHQWREPARTREAIIRAYDEFAEERAGKPGRYGLPWQREPGRSLKMSFPSAEWLFTVIRICECGKEWGQR